MKIHAALKQAGGLFAALALAGIGVLAVPSAAVAEGTLTLSGEAAEATVDGAGRVTLTVANEGDDPVRLTGLTAPTGFDCAPAEAILAPGGRSILDCTGKYADRESASFGVTGTAGKTESSADTTVPLPRTPVKAEPEPEAEGAVLSVDVKANKTTVHPGDPVTYTITVKNVHPTFTILDVVVRSPDVEECERDLGDMSPGQVEEYTCVSPAPDQSFTVRIRVRGFDSGGTQIGEHDNDVRIEVLPPSPSPSASSSASESSPTPSTPVTPTGPGNGGGLAVTGPTATLLAIVGAVLLAGGAGLWLLAQRRRAETYGD
ncbi:hypothetical protein [Phytomonospora endophytica]|uniref:DUF11 domain-containing protein n=1 Tax=Phytomonospora endophytica TaxID=714109 RepID=A0A841G054_9ACTN|nr:hypothetical protein [Phytomonospora endophytica]MBB6038069.1 hypothetical protein [Phytomonospora endophytica]GIG67467.1 hypothetical protein Pen01_37620 [Phytomonospora endophytica]